MQTRVSLCVGPQRAESSPSAAQPASIALTLDRPPASPSKFSYYGDGGGKAITHPQNPSTAVFPNLPTPIALHPHFP
jgi:hypothetical protein